MTQLTIYNTSYSWRSRQTWRSSRSSIENYSIINFQGPKTKGELKGWGNLGKSVSTGPAGPMSHGTPTPGQKQRQSVDTSSAFATFQKAAKEKADRWGGDWLYGRISGYFGLFLGRELWESSRKLIGRLWRGKKRKGKGLNRKRGKKRRKKKL